MRYATITPTTAGQPWVIGDDALARGPGSRYILAGFPSFTHTVQGISYLNQAFTANLPWGNRDVKLALTVEHEFRDESACFLFICRLGLDCPGSGNLELGTRGTSSSRINFPFAVLDDLNTFEATQVSVKLNYRFSLGRPV